MRREEKQLAPTTPRKNVKDAIKEQMTRRVVSSFLDVLVVYHFKDQEFSGYDVTQYINKKLNVWLSPGTIYSTLYAMEREGYLEVISGEKKRVFKVSEKGKILGQVFSCPADMLEYMQGLMEK